MPAFPRFLSDRKANANRRKSLHHGSNLSECQKVFGETKRYLKFNETRRLECLNGFIIDSTQRELLHLPRRTKTYEPFVHRCLPQKSEWWWWQKESSNKLRIWITGRTAGTRAQQNLFPLHERPLMREIKKTSIERACNPETRSSRAEFIFIQFIFRMLRKIIEFSHRKTILTSRFYTRASCWIDEIIASPSSAHLSIDQNFWIVNCVASKVASVRGPPPNNISNE